ncbi:MAG: integral rane protein [Pseudonocardia sp.]|nr:integral rane protein [Pseudonocardia sp.]
MASQTSPSSADVPPVLPSIPLAPEPTLSAENQSIGRLVREVATQVSTLVRSEVELARAEVTAEVKKGIRGSVLFILALAVLTFSLFFFFFFLAELLAVWLPRWASFGIVFLLMVLTAGLFGLLGFRRVRKIRAPQRTIETVKDTAQTLSRRRRAGTNASTGPAELAGNEASPPAPR